MRAKHGLAGPGKEQGLAEHCSLLPADSEVTRDALFPPPQGLSAVTLARSVPARKRDLTQKMTRGTKRISSNAVPRNAPISCGDVLGGRSSRDGEGPGVLGPGRCNT